MKIGIKISFEQKACMFLKPVIYRLLDRNWQLLWYMCILQIQKCYKRNMWNWILLALFTLKFKNVFNHYLNACLYLRFTKAFFRLQQRRQILVNPLLGKVMCSAVVISVRFRTLSHFLKKTMFSWKLICLHVRKIQLLSQALIIFKLSAFYTQGTVS